MRVTDPNVPKINLAHKKIKVIINRCYENSTNTKKTGDFVFITFTKVFKYLSSIVSYDPDDYADMNFRIKKAKQAIGTLIFF